ncbi:MAG: four helix bundle protein [Anaeromyxobacter sp.]|nr:four helix bundle protein [Anaeromyxobacter sp.]MBL0276391.1 four helix bundle protein [Anaeromyxobacter sp.]
MNDHHSLFADHTATVPRGFTSSPASGPAGSSSTASVPRSSSSPSSVPRSSSSPSSGPGGPSSSPLGAGEVSLPHHRLIAYGVALELLAAVRAAQVRDPKLRDEALRSAKSACLNSAEGAGRVSRPDKARSFAIARAEAGEAAAAVEIAASCGDASPAAAARVNQVAHRLVALLTGLIR